MPYKDKGKDTRWHREKMRERRLLEKTGKMAYYALSQYSKIEEMRLGGRFVTPDVTPKVDADGNAMPDFT